MRGRDLMSGLPKTVILSPEEVREAIDEPVSAHRRLGRRAASARRRPSWPRTSSSSGMYLVGGGGMLRGLDQRIERETEVPVHLVDAPLECVVLGAGHCIEPYDALKVMFMGARR